MGESIVIKDTCEKIHKSVDEKFERDFERLNEHTLRIKTVEEAIVKLTADVDKYKQKSTSFWNTKSGQAIPICTTIILIIVVAALVGTNLIEGWQQVKDYVPKG